MTRERESLKTSSKVVIASPMRPSLCATSMESTVLAMMRKVTRIMSRWTSRKLTTSLPSSDSHSPTMSADCRVMVSAKAAMRLR